MQKHLVIIGILFSAFVQFSWANNPPLFQCELDSNAPGVETTAQEFAKKVKKFQYKAEQVVSGVKVENTEVSAFLWMKEGLINVMVKELKSENLAKATYLPLQPKFLLQLGLNHTLKCDQNPPAGKETGELSIENLTSNSDILKLKTPVSIQVKKSFMVSFEDPSEEMWAAKFQNGENYISLAQIEKKFPRCFFTVKPKIKRTVWTIEREKYAVKSVSINKNNKQEIVWSASFVDFSSGHIKSDSMDYTPFTFECVILKTPFTVQDLSKITGANIELVEK
jgi:hypothetical protein